MCGLFSDLLFDGKNLIACGTTGIIYLDISFTPSTRTHSNYTIGDINALTLLPKNHIVAAGCNNPESIIYIMNSDAEITHQKGLPQNNNRIVSLR